VVYFVPPISRWYIIRHNPISATFRRVPIINSIWYYRFFMIVVILRSPAYSGFGFCSRIHPSDISGGPTNVWTSKYIFRYILEVKDRADSTLGRSPVLLISSSFQSNTSLYRNYLLLAIAFFVSHAERRNNFVDLSVAFQQNQLLSGSSPDHCFSDLCRLNSYKLPLLRRCRRIPVYTH
jgi:hypothetical protein